jgi:predicted amidohydrolase YtcJ
VLDKLLLAFVVCIKRRRHILVDIVYHYDGRGLVHVWVTPVGNLKPILLVEAGISPPEVNKIATRNGAQALGIERDVGTIESGKQADMIVPSENPSDNISNTEKIEGVIVDGQFIDSKQNQRLK